MREETARSVLRERTNQSILETMVPRLFGKTILEKHPQRVEPLLAVMERTSPQGVAGALRGMAVRPDRRGDLARIAVPTLVMVGEDDVISPVAGGPRDCRGHSPRPAGGDPRGGPPGSVREPVRRERGDPPIPEGAGPPRTRGASANGVILCRDRRPEGLIRHPPGLAWNFP